MGVALRLFPELVTGLVVLSTEGKRHLSLRYLLPHRLVTCASQHLVLLLDIRLNHLRVVECKGERIEHLGGPKLRVALEDGLHLRTVSEEGIDTSHGDAGTIDKRATPEHRRLNANVGVWNEYDRKRQGETSHSHS